MKLQCPKCAAESEHTIDPFKGTHLEYPCNCGVKLQCDFPVLDGGRLPGGGFSVNVGSPRACTHKHQFDPLALVPIWVPRN
jgi:hypothetical protein